MIPQHDSIPQAGAIPFRVGEGGRPEVLLIRWEDSPKWGIPKGLVDEGLTHQQAAALEALEEAGVEGELAQEPLGSFTYEKFHGLCEVQVFPMKVTRVRETYREWPHRRRQWFEISQAAVVVNKKAVRQLIERLAAKLEERAPG